MRQVFNDGSNADTIFTVEKKSYQRNRLNISTWLYEVKWKPFWVILRTQAVDLMPDTALRALKQLQLEGFVSPPWPQFSRRLSLRPSEDSGATNFFSGFSHVEKEWWLARKLGTLLLLCWSWIRWRKGKHPFGKLLSTCG